MNPDHQSLRARLLARHASATPQLEALRRAALPTLEISWRDFLRELFHPYRTAWRALALVWLGLLIFQLTLGRSSRPTSTTPPAPEAVAAWLAQLKSNETLAQLDSRP